MATSGSTDFAVTRDVLVKDALVDIGMVAAEDTVSAGLNAFAVRKLNMMIKTWQADGLNLWKMKRVTVLLEKSKQTYSLGPSGDLACLTGDLNETAMRVAAVATDTTMEVDTTTGMTAGDFVAVVMDDGELHTTTIDSVTDSDTFELTTGLTAAAAIDKAVYWFTNKIARPLLISQEDAFLRDSSNNDVPVRVISRSEYNQFSNKTNTGDIIQVYYDPQLTNGKLSVYNTAETVTDSLELTCQMPIEDMDAASNDFDFPQEWYLPLQTNLAVLLAPSSGISSEEFKKLTAIADDMKERVMGWDKEWASTYFEPNTYGK